MAVWRCSLQSLTVILHSTNVLYIHLAQFLLPGRPAECAWWAIFAHAGHCAAFDGASAPLRISAKLGHRKRHRELLMWFSRYQGLHQVIWICEMASVLGRFDKVCGFCAPWGYATKWLLCRSTPGTWTKHHWKVGETVPLRALEKHPASYGRSAVPGEINSSRTCFPCEPLCSEMVVGGQVPKERERMKTKEKWGKNKQRTEMKVKWNWKNSNLQRMFSKPARL